MINTAISACVVAEHDERTYRACLESLGWCEEIVVVEVRAGELTPAQKRAAVRDARHDWILFLQGDERVSPELAGEIRRRKLYGLDECAAYELPFLSVDGWPDHRVRLFNRRRVALSGVSAQDRVVPHGPVGRFDGHVLHDSWCEADVARVPADCVPRRSSA